MIVNGALRGAGDTRWPLAINLIGVLVISLLFFFFGTAILEIDPANLPAWAVPGG